VSAFSPARRAAIVERAGNRCEYCQLPTRGQLATFPIDHILPKSQGGSQELDNLALTCPHCNDHKWTGTEGIDPKTGESVPL
jgi:5-methylcytosine-specific restriction endonuclease McrA